MTHYACFSQKQVDRGLGTHIYATPDGTEVEVTEVQTNPNCSNNIQPDKQLLGEVTHWVRKGRPENIEHNPSVESVPYNKQLPYGRVSEYINIDPVPPGTIEQREESARKLKQWLKGLTKTPEGPELKQWLKDNPYPPP